MALRDVTRGDRPDLTAAQILGALLAAIPNLVVLFGVELSEERTVALGALVAFGLSLIGGDAYLRGKRNEADAVRDAAQGAGAGGEKVGVGDEKVDLGGEEVDVGGEEVDVGGEEVDVGGEEVEVIDDEPEADEAEFEPEADEAEFEHEDDDPTGEEHVPDDVALPPAVEEGGVDEAEPPPAEGSRLGTDAAG